MQTTKKSLGTFLALGKENSFLLHEDHYSAMKADQQLAILLNNFIPLIATPG
jgi:hypothetical protein